MQSWHVVTSIDQLVFFLDKSFLTSPVYGPVSLYWAASLHELAQWAQGIWTATTSAFWYRFRLVAHNKTCTMTSSSYASLRLQSTVQQWEDLLQGTFTCGLPGLISFLCNELHTTISAVTVLLKTEAQTVKQGEFTPTFNCCSLHLSWHSFCHRKLTLMKLAGFLKLRCLAFSYKSNCTQLWDCSLSVLYCSACP